MNLGNLPSHAMGLPPKHCVRPCAAGIDIRPGSWDTIIGDVVKNPKGEYVSRIVFQAKLDDEDQVEQVIAAYGVACAVKDSRPETTIAERLQKRLRKKGIQSWRCSYLTTPSDVKILEVADEGIIRVDRTMTLDDIPWQMNTGTMAVPQNFRSICRGEFLQEMCASTRLPRITHGREWWDWDNARNADHSFHALNYLLLAIQVGKLMFRNNDAVMATTAGFLESPQVALERRANEESDEEGQVVWTV